MSIAAQTLTILDAAARGAAFSESWQNSPMTEAAFHAEQGQNESERNWLSCRQ